MNYFRLLILSFVTLSASQRQYLIPASLRQRLCEKHSSLSICNLQQEDSINRENALNRWKICEDYPHLLLCRMWRSKQTEDETFPKPRAVLEASEVSTPIQTPIRNEVDNSSINVEMRRALKEKDEEDTENVEIQEFDDSIFADKNLFTGSLQ